MEMKLKKNKKPFTILIYNKRFCDKITNETQIVIRIQRDIENSLLVNSYFGFFETITESILLFTPMSVLFSLSQQA